MNRVIRDKYFTGIIPRLPFNAEEGMNNDRIPFFIPAGDKIKSEDEATLQQWKYLEKVKTQKTLLGFEAQSPEEQ